MLDKVCLTYGLFAIGVATDSTMPKGVRVVARVVDGPYEEVQDGYTPAGFAFAFERAGTYDIEVTARGYVPWKRTGVRIEKDKWDCHVLPQAFRVVLERK